ncbi:GNAT family N-acetyltransferase [Paenibacillus sp. J2TS4]|uniref:GNAT family N-acetyltransferase n=1 Tax=Paenibacillus sp. J2TS4 TaxID=2807194 RepID=UPI001B227EC2|nr:GNAT family N-acetyltransferase [Paenibacillus sp. J2TS4]GIP31800.1 hypothetical protein J2TS4_10100 [Paenibacillus sp. J2TS4]
MTIVKWRPLKEAQKGIIEEFNEYGEGYLMKYTVRTIQIPGDYEQVARIMNHVLSEEINAEILADEDAKIPSKGVLKRNENGLLTGFDRFRLVAVDEQEHILGYGISWRAPWTADGELNHTLVVGPQYRNQGIGNELYKNLEEWAVANGANKLNYEVRDNELSSIEFAKKNGYTIERHSFESILDLSSFDRSLLEQINKQLLILPLSEITDTDKEERLYELYRETSIDIPGFNGDFFEFNEWRKWTLELPGSSPEYVLVAMDQSQYIGVAHILYQASTQSMYHEYTGVNKAYRGQGIGLTLKLKSIELAMKLNIKYMRTNNDSFNTPMLKINRDQLKFKAVPGNYKMVKNL